MNPELRSLSKTDRSNDEHSAAEALLRTHLDGDCDCSNPFAVLGDDYDFGQAMAAFKQMEEDSVAFVQKASTT